jgi:hypothetical protein
VREQISFGFDSALGSLFRLDVIIAANVPHVFRMEVRRMNVHVLMVTGPTELLV